MKKICFQKEYNLLPTDESFFVHKKCNSTYPIIKRVVNISDGDGSSWFYPLNVEISEKRERVRGNEGFLPVVKCIHTYELEITSNNDKYEPHEKHVPQLHNYLKKHESSLDTIAEHEFGIRGTMLDPRKTGESSVNKRKVATNSGSLMDTPEDESSVNKRKAATNSGSLMDTPEDEEMET